MPEGGMCVHVGACMCEACRAVCVPVGVLGGEGRQGRQDRQSSQKPAVELTL